MIHRTPSRLTLARPSELLHLQVLREREPLQQLS